jgi:hypothetical protein
MWPCQHILFAENERVGSRANTWVVAVLPQHGLLPDFDDTESRDVSFERTMRMRLFGTLVRSLALLSVLSLVTWGLGCQPATQKAGTGKPGSGTSKASSSKDKGGDHDHKDGDHDHKDGDHDHKDGDHDHKDGDHDHKDGDDAEAGSTTGGGTTPPSEG